MNLLRLFFLFLFLESSSTFAALSECQTRYATPIWAMEAWFAHDLFDLSTDVQWGSACLLGQCNVTPATETIVNKPPLPITTQQQKKRKEKKLTINETSVRGFTCNTTYIRYSLLLVKSYSGWGCARTNPFVAFLVYSTVVLLTPARIHKVPLGSAMC